MKSILSLLFTFCSIVIWSQEKRTLTFNSDASIVYPSTPIQLPSDNLVSNFTFRKLVFEDLAHLLLGNTTAPSEGIEASLNEATSTISLSGILTSGKLGILSVKGDFSASDGGIYFIDEEGGSSNATFALNYYLPLGGARSYNNPVIDENLQRGFYEIEKGKQELIANVIRDFYYTKYLLDQAGIPNSYTEKKIEKMKRKLRDVGYTLDLSQIRSDLALKSAEYINEKKLDGNSYDNAIKIVIEKKDDDDLLVKRSYVPELGKEFVIKPDIDIDKVIALYDKTITAMDSISYTLVKKENALSQKHWNSKNLHFIGISPFYEREELKNIYTPNDTLSFDKNFVNGNKDLIGFEGQYGFFYQSSGQNGNGFTPKMLFLRATLGFGKTTNKTKFENRTFAFSPTIVDTLSGSNVTTINSSEGNINSNGNPYSVGNRFSIGGEVYYFPLERYGLFGQVGYNKLNFDTSEGEDKELYNLRLGLVINLKNKKKNFATLQLFADRSDLSLSPNSTDKDLRFGFKLGLPFNFTQKL
ncbi:hypothetical protein [uncultured Dokdonia sp.]|uniref:hypothetical protein n=1 Tax=uncultured Dokdonia sp. TaxID=575653 RepID=UPI0030EB1F33|tara:strand:+ start:18652 stop:20235 length:1584 start_codon:yes stop_codon:yes gene_type:complete